MSRDAHKVLLVEDSPTDVALLREMLARATFTKFDVQCAVRLSDALDILADEQQIPDVIVVDANTLQHRRYSNVFCLGDVAGIPMAKTGASVRAQYKVVVDNLLAAIEESELCYRYNGYTVCPIVTGTGKVILAEFDYSGRPRASLPIDPKQERYLWWLFKLYLNKPMVYMGMLKGWI